MNFDFSNEQKQLGEQTRRFLDNKLDATRLRETIDGREAYDLELWREFAAFGALGFGIPEGLGGNGGGALEVAILAEEVGRSLAPIPFSSCSYLVAPLLLAAKSGTAKEKLAKIAAGERIGAFAFTERAGAPSFSMLARFEDGAISGEKSVVQDGQAADFALVCASDDKSACAVYLVELGQEGVERTPLSSVDPTHRAARIRFNRAHASPLGIVGENEVRQAFDRAAVFFAFEQLGGAERTLEMARDYALERMAFGRQIGAFQAIKHMLADMYVEITLARSNCLFAVWALSTGAADLPLAAATARLSATRAYQHCARNNIQVHGGMGFTWESDCHLHHRRAALLAGVLGGQSWWERQLVDALSASSAHHSEA